MKKYKLTITLTLAALCTAALAYAAPHGAAANAPAPTAAQQVAPARAPDGPHGPPDELREPPDEQPGPDDELAFLAGDGLDLGDDGPGDGPGDDAQLGPGGGMRGPGGMGGWGMHRGGPGMGPMRGRGMGPMGGGRGALMAKLNLSDAQREKLADIRDRQMRRGIQARSDLAIARLDLRKALRGERPDVNAADAQIDHIAKVRAELAKSRIASMLEARNVLTPEQQKQMRELHGGMGMRGGMGAPGMGGDGQQRGRWRHVRGGDADSSGHGSM